jgi:thiol-disulfide isomerase/thioredoxin
VVTTDDQGRFNVLGLVVGEAYDLVVHNEEESRMSTAQTKIAPTDPGSIALGDVAIDLSPPKPYVPPTPAQRAGEAFAARKEKSPREKLEYVLIEASREYTRPLLLFGGPKDPACVDLFRLFDEGSNGEDPARAKTPGDLRWEFELSSLDAASAEVATFAKDLGVPLGDGKTPMLAVLSDEGKLAATYPLRPGTDGKLDAGPLAAFLLDHKLPTRDAETMLAEGLAKAKAEDKRVFLIMSASWCGPCRLLARFLVASKAELDRHYVFVKLDVSRDAQAESIKKRFKGSESGGVPWYVILDDAGQPLITSNAKELEEQYGNTNVGFPSSKEGIDHFLKMLKQTAPRLSEDAQTSLRHRLSAKP